MPGSSGNSGERSAVLTASMRSLPAWASGSTEGGVPKVRSTSPAATACIDGAPPLNGTCSMRSPPLAPANDSVARCVITPAPEEE